MAVQSLLGRSLTAGRMPPTAPNTSGWPGAMRSAPHPPSETPPLPWGPGPGHAGGPPAHAGRAPLRHDAGRARPAPGLRSEVPLEDAHVRRHDRKRPAAVGAPAPRARERHGAADDEPAAPDLEGHGARVKGPAYRFGPAEAEARAAALTSSTSPA